MYLSGMFVTENDFNVFWWSREAECKERSCIKDTHKAGCKQHANMSAETCD